MKILINLVGVDKRGTVLPWIYKIKRFQEHGHKVYINNGVEIVEVLRIDSIDKFNEDFPGYKHLPEYGTEKKDFIVYALKRNIVSLKLIPRIRKNKFQLIYSPSSVLDLILFPYLVKVFYPKIKWVTVFDNIVPLKDAGNKIYHLLAWLFFQISLLLLRKADYIFVISADLKQRLLIKGFPKNKLIVTGNAVEVDLIAKAKGSKKYNIDALFIGRINETKGIYDMLKVLEIIKYKYPNFQLALMGRGDTTTEKSYKQAIRKMGLKNNVQLLGYKMGLEKFTIIKSAKCFLFLSHSDSESFGIALLEAVCCGVKAFAYNLKPYKDIYKNGEVNLFAVRDYKAVASAVIKTFEEKTFGNPKGELLVDKYSWDKIADIEYETFTK